MSFHPVLAPALLIGIGAVLIAIRMAALYRVLVRTGSGRYRTVVLRWSGLTLAVLLLVGAAFRPGIEPPSHGDEQNRPVALGSTNLNVFFVVDRSVDSRVEDYGERQSRMSGIRSDISALIDQYPQARFTMLSFATKADVDWPMSKDLWSLIPMVEGLSPYTRVDGDAAYNVDAGAANDLLRAELQRAKELYPKSKNVVFYLGTGGGTSRAQQTDFDLPDDAVAAGAVLGYGSAEGGPIPQGWVNGRLVHMWDRSANQPLHSSLNEPRLRRIADQLGLQYYHRESGKAISAVAPAVESERAPDSEDVLIATRMVERNELYWVFSLLAGALVLVEIYLTIVEFRRGRMARRGGAQ